MTKVLSGDLRGLMYALYFLLPEKVECQFSSTDESLPEPVAHPSSSSPSTQIGRLLIRSMTCWLSSYATKFHSTSSLMYTSWEI